MAGKEIVVMSQWECHRLHIVRKAIDKEMTQVEAAEILDLSDRQIRRIVKQVREEGDPGIAHKLRGKKSNRAIAVEIKGKVLKLYTEKYHDFGPLLASEKITELDKINIKDDVLRNWLLEAGLWQLSRKQRKHRQRRERKHRLGTMLQGDGSHHDWFEGRGPKCVLMGWIDDATSCVYARFYEYEGTLPAMDSFKRYIKKYGLPYSIYLDKHPTYKSTAKQTIEDELENRKRLSQFERAVKELAVVLIHANSPQAKGRIERLFRTFQDRVIKEMRLKGVKNISEANKFLRYYLPAFNNRFEVEAIEKGDLHRVVSANIDLNRILCIKTKRSLRNDFTVAHDTKLYQVLDDITTKKVTVEDRVNGKRYIVYKDKDLKYKEITQRPAKKSSKAKKIKERKFCVPAQDHPWRKFKIKKVSSKQIFLGKEKIA